MATVVLKSIGQKALERLLFAVSRSRMVSFASVTDPDMTKTDNPFFGTVRKVTFGIGVICWNYGRTVNRQRVREGKRDDFKSKHRSWGLRVKGTPLVSHIDSDHKARLYLEIKIQSRHSHYIDTTTGKPLTPRRLKVLAKFLTPIAPTRQQLDKTICLRDYRLDHIAELSLDGTRYTIAPAARELQLYFPSKADTVSTAKPRKRTTAPTPRKKRATKTAKGAT